MNKCGKFFSKEFRINWNAEIYEIYAKFFPMAICMAEMNSPKLIVAHSFILKMFSVQTFEMILFFETIKFMTFSRTGRHAIVWQIQCKSRKMLNQITFTYSIFEPNGDPNNFELWQRQTEQIYALRIKASECIANQNETNFFSGSVERFGG